MRCVAIYFVAFLGLLCVSCGVGDQISLVADVDAMQWREAAEFDISNSDTHSKRDISLYVRYEAANVKVDSLPLHIVTIAPDQSKVVEQFTLYFSRGSGGLWRHRVFREALYRKDVRFNQNGDYKVLIYPQRPTKGVESVGIIIK